MSGAPLLNQTKSTPAFDRFHEMRSPLIFQLLTLALLNHILYSIAFPTAATLNSSVTPAILNSSPLNSVDFSRTVSLGIATAQRAYPRIIPRVYAVTAVTLGRPRGVPFLPSRVILRLHITHPKNIVMINQAPWGPWDAPEEREEPASFHKPAFDWDRLPLSFIDAQMKIDAAENVPKNRKIFDSVAIFVLEYDHPTQPIPEGELVFTFIRQGQVGSIAYTVVVVATSGEVFLDDYGLETADVQTT